MSAVSQPGAPVIYKAKGEPIDSILPALAALIVCGVAFEILVDRWQPAIIPCLTVAHSHPQGWREHAFAFLGAALVTVLLAGGLMLDDWRMGSGDIDGLIQNRDNFSLLWFFPALLASWITGFSLGRRAVRPEPEDKLSMLDLPLTQSMAFLFAVFLFSAGLSFAVDMVFPATNEIGCGFPIALLSMFLMLLLFGGMPILLAWPRAGKYKTALLGRLGLGLIAVGLAYYGGRWIDCALEGGWLGFTGFVLLAAIYIAAVALPAINIARFAHNNNLLRPPEWDAPEAEGSAP